MSDDLEIGIDVEAEAFDGTDRPAAGTACARCRTLFGHFCPAKGYAGERPLCLACGTGQQCEQTAAVLRMERGGGWDEMQVDERGTFLHGECRSVPITEADRAAAKESTATAWTIKASLSAENLKRVKQARPIVVTARRRQGKKLERERDAGRRRRMNEISGKIEGAAAIAAVPGNDAAKLCSKVEGCDRPNGHSGKHRHNALALQVSARSMTLRAGKVKQKVRAVPMRPAEPAPEFLQLRVPVSAMDRLFAMMPATIKGAAVEKLLVELAGA